MEEHGVDYVAVGGIALAAHGVVRATVDVDVICDPAPANLERLGRAIAALEGHPSGEPETAVTPALLARDANMRFATAAGQLDVLGAAQYRDLFPELQAAAVSATVDDLRVVVASRNDLIRMKAGSGRDRDLLDIGDLLALEE